MTEHSVRMNNPDFVEKTNKAHKVFLEELRLPDDREFPNLLSNAALNLCVILKHIELDLLIYADELVQAVKMGFERKDLLHGLSEEERGHVAYSKRRFTKIFKDKLDENSFSREKI